jgi:hypothetical protein
LEIGRWGTLIPYQVPLVTVVGSPIHVEAVANPSKEQVNALHERYVQALVDLYEEHKDVYFKDRIREMRFVK